MRGTKFLQIGSFSTILTFLHSFNFSFPLLFYVISIAMPTFLSWFPASPHWLPTFSTIPHRFPAYPRWFPGFPSHSSHSLYSVPQFPASSFWFRNLFQENSCFSSKINAPLCYYSTALGTKLFTSSMTSSVISPKIIYVLLPPVKTYNLWIISK